MNIGIIGQGFVGNAVFQKFKNYYNTLTYDKDLNKCNSTFEKTVLNSEIIFVCLPTPMNKNGSCDITIVESVLNDIDNFKLKKIIILKSTIPPRTTSYFNDKFKNLSIVFNPEFLTERNAINDYQNQDRIILGGPRPSTGFLKQIFNNVFPNAHIIKTGSTHAEFIKYFINCFLATKVTFSNEMFDLAKSLDLDYDKVVEYAILDSRLGKSHFNVPGPDGDRGFGGHCFPKDLNALIYLSNKMNTCNNLLKSVIKTNDSIRTNRDWEKMKGRAIN